MVNEKRVGAGEVFLIAGGGKTYTDIAARFCRTEKDVEELIASPQNKELIKAIIKSGHKAALEFDEFIFGIQGYSRVTEVQLVRKRHGSYMIKSGRVDEHGKRTMDVVIPDQIKDICATAHLDCVSRLRIKIGDNEFDMWEVINGFCNNHLIDLTNKKIDILYDYYYEDILTLIDEWYTAGVIQGVSEEWLRFMKPQATEFKAAIKFNAAALRDWALIRMCNRAQGEIRDMCLKMVNLAKEAAPELMEGIGPSCKVYGYCPEGEQCSQCKGKIPTKEQTLKFIRMHAQDIMNNDEEEVES